MDKNCEKSKKETKFSLFFKKMHKKFDYMMFPDDIKCLFCENDIPNFYEKPYCAECEKIIQVNDGHRCIICDTPIDDEAKVCDNCRKHVPNFKKAFCAFVYEGVVKNSVLSYKNDNKRYLAKGYAICLAKKLKDLKIDFITFIPLTKKKLKERSFNQSQLLATELGKILDVPVVDAFEKVKEEATAQKFLNFAERQKNIVGLYKLKKIDLNKNMNVLIVDDVMTTGATLSFCSGLLKNKVKNVYVSAVARTKLKIKLN